MNGRSGVVVAAGTWPVEEVVRLSERRQWEEVSEPLSDSVRKGLVAHKVTALSLAPGSASSEALEILRSLENLRELVVRWDRLNGFRLQDFPNLDLLSVATRSMSPGLEAEEVTGLRVLDVPDKFLRGTLTDAAIRLQYLTLYGAPIDVARTIGDVPNLTSLSLKSRRSTKEPVSVRWDALPKSLLRIQMLNVVPRTLDGIQALSHLETLAIEINRCPPNMVELDRSVLQMLPRLKHVTLSGVPILN